MLLASIFTASRVENYAGAAQALTKKSMAVHKISKLLSPDTIDIHLEATGRLDAINETTSLLKNHPNVLNFQSFYDEIITRENLEPTCIGNGIAFPHAKPNHVKGMVIAAGRSIKGVHFETCNQDIHLIFVIGTSQKMAPDYLGVVGSLARILKDASTREKLLQAKTAQEFYKILNDAEKQL
jgi:mannitol/fructose-specific phosphotransferase system IIA component (Ntr-type)